MHGTLVGWSDHRGNVRTTDRPAPDAASASASRRLSVPDWIRRVGDLSATVKAVDRDMAPTCAQARATPSARPGLSRCRRAEAGTGFGSVIAPPVGRMANSATVQPRIHLETCAWICFRSRRRGEAAKRDPATGTKTAAARAADVRILKPARSPVFAIAPMPTTQSSWALAGRPVHPLGGPHPWVDRAHCRNRGDPQVRT